MKQLKKSLPEHFISQLESVHPSWREILVAGLHAVHQANPTYLLNLQHASYLPSQGRLFAAFSRPVEEVKFVLVGEGPYPREESATGYCFMDGAVGALWSDAPDGGLSKAVNRATSLRNFIKMLLLAEGSLSNGDYGAEALAPIARLAKGAGTFYIQTIADLQEAMLNRGFLLLNASLVFRKEVAPAIDARAWEPFVAIVLDALVSRKQASCDSSGLSSQKITLILWGKIADRLLLLPACQQFLIARCEHPYNLSFIENQVMHALFAPMSLLHK